MKRIITWAMFLVLTLSFCACGSAKNTDICSVPNCSNPVYKDGLCPDHYVEAKSSSSDEESDTNTPVETDAENKNDINQEDTSIDKNENSRELDEIGLKNIKLDSSILKLTPEQKLLVQYFDQDYFSSQYSFIRKYPQLFDGMQVQAMECAIMKIIGQDNDKYEMLAAWDIRWDDRLGIYHYGDEYPIDESEVKQNLVLLRGNTKDQYYMEKENLTFRGRCDGVETVTVDGVSYTVPVINVYMEGAYYRYQDIKTIAEMIFGNQISITASGDKSADGNFYGDYDITLDNQTNAKFGKYCIAGDVFRSSLYDRTADFYTTTRKIEFSPDFEHFFLITYNLTVDNLTIEYYDKDLKQIWKREFENTNTSCYDYTRSKAYIVVNGYLYVIDMNTGEDVVEKKYVGEKIELRKVKEGVILFADGKSDTIMMTDDEGNIKWTNSAKNNVHYVEHTQFKDDCMICSLGTSSDTGYDMDEYIQIDLKSGDIILEVEDFEKLD